jgi:hypothetical protein
MICYRKNSVIIELKDLVCNYMHFITLLPHIKTNALLGGRKEFYYFLKASLGIDFIDFIIEKI